MTDDPLRELEHPRGTLFVIGLYGLLFVLGWVAIYVLVYLARGGVTA